MAVADQMSSEARVSIASPRRYLGQLCKHFGHKMPATYAEDYGSGRIEFPDLGVCTLEAADAGGLLVMQAAAGTEDELARLEAVVARHLERFAFRDPLTVTWQRNA